jgi:hypothetical protein
MTRASHAAIRETLAACGPLTSRELMSFFPASSQQDIAGLLGSMRKRVAVRQVYIHSWTREADHARDYIRAVYALGDLPDARKPKPMSNAERCRRHKARKALPRVPNSVFNLAAFL